MSEKMALQHVNIMVDDLAKNVAFYRDVIGLELDETPALDFPAQFFKFANGAQIHMNEFKENIPTRAHFCIVVDDFNAVFARVKEADAIDVETWGKIRRLPTGTMQMFVRDPAGNLVELASTKEDEISSAVLSDELVETTSENALFKSGRDDPRRGAS